MLILRTITLELIVWRSELVESIGWLVSLVETIKFKKFHLRCCIRFIQTRKRFSIDIDLLCKYCGMEKETTPNLFLSMYVFKSISGLMCRIKSGQ